MKNLKQICTTLQRVIMRRHQGYVLINVFIVQKGYKPGVTKEFSFYNDRMVEIVDEVESIRIYQRKNYEASYRNIYTFGSRCSE